jgi:KEOPS complex subunit Cgi121
MITEIIGSYLAFVQGFKDARLIDSEGVLRDLRGSFQGVELQLLRADRIAGKEHIIFAAKNAVYSFEGENRRAKHLSMELLLFASGEHQIVEAIKLLGVAASTTELALVGFSETRLDPDEFSSGVAKAVNGVPDDGVLELYKRKKTTGLMRVYNISERELDSARIPGETESDVLKRLVIERSALLALEN